MKRLMDEDRRKIPWSVRGKPKMSKGTCKICGTEFERNSGAQKYCKECRVPNEHYRKFLERLDPSAFLEYSEKERASCKKYHQLYKTTETVFYFTKSEECPKCGVHGFRYHWRSVNKKTGWKGKVEVSIVHIRRDSDGKRGVGYSCYLGKKDDI